MKFSRPWRSEQAGYSLVCPSLLLWGHYLHWGNHCFWSQLRSPVDGTEMLKGPRISGIKNGAVSCTNANTLNSLLAIYLGQISRILRGGTRSEIKIRTVVRTQRSFGCLASLHLELWTSAECKKNPNRYCHSKLLQSEALSPPDLLLAPSNVLQFVLEYTFLSKATQKGNGIKQAAHLQQIFPEKGHAQISISGKSSKKNKKHLLRASRSVEPILTKKKAGKNSLPTAGQKFEEGKRVNKVTEITFW